MNRCDTIYNIDVPSRNVISVIIRSLVQKKKNGVAKISQINLCEWSLYHNIIVCLNFDPNTIGFNSLKAIK